MSVKQPLKLWTARQLAALVKQLRTVQKASGVGYKTPAATSAAQLLEVQVDVAVAEIEQFHLF